LNTATATRTRVSSVHRYGRVLLVVCVVRCSLAREKTNAVRSFPRRPSQVKQSSVCLVQSGTGSDHQLAAAPSGHDCSVSVSPTTMASYCDDLDVNVRTRVVEENMLFTIPALTEDVWRSDPAVVEAGVFKVRPNLYVSLSLFMFVFASCQSVPLFER